VALTVAGSKERWINRKDTMTFGKELCTTVISLGVFLFASQTYAFGVTDVSINNLAGTFESSSAVQRGKGNFKKADINGLFAGDPWALLDTTDKSSNDFLDVSFLFTADAKQKSGAWELNWSGSPLPLYMDFALIMKGGKEWGAYLFESRNVNSGTGAADGKFLMPSVSKKGRIPKLRQASIFGRLAEIPAGPTSIPKVPANIPAIQTDIPAVLTDMPEALTDIPVFVTNPPVNVGAIPIASDSNSIPVPGSLALLAIGLGLGLRQLRQRH
jgi:hypothetical protein